MLIASEFQTDAKGFSDLLDYFALVAPGVVLTSTGRFIAGWEYVSPDMDAMPLADCWQVANRLERRLRLGSGWTIEAHLIRGERREYAAPSEWPDPVSYLIEQERRARFNMQGEAATRGSRYFLTVVYEPGLRMGAKASSWLFSSKEKGTNSANEKSLALFEKRVAEIHGLLSNTFSQVERLTSHEHGRLGVTYVYDDLLRFLRQCINSEDHLFTVPGTPAFLNQYLATDDLTGGARPHLGDPDSELSPGKYIAVIAIDSFPENGYAGMLRELDSVSYDFRYTQQAELLDEQAGKDKHEVNKSKWKFKKKSIVKQAMPGAVDDGSSDDPYALKMQLEAQTVASAVEHGKEVAVKFHAKLILMDSDPERMKEASEALIRVVKYHCGFGCRIETTNVVAAWLGSLPGQQHKDPRTFLLNTFNASHMMPLSAPFRGHQYNPSPYFAPHSPPLLYGVTSGGTPYRFNPYVGDVGHTLIVGPTRAGKTTLQALAISQFFRYTNAQVFCFDKKRTLYTLCRAMGGDFYDLSPNSVTTKVCPLHELATPSDRDRGAQILELLLTLNDVRVTPDMRNDIGETLRRMSAYSGDRSLTSFHMAVPSKEVQAGLQFYLGGLLDGSTDTISMSRFCVFEMDELYRLDKKTMNGVLFYLFGRISTRLSSAVPTLMAVDEFRESLEHPMAAAAFENYLFECGKLNTAVWLIVQELSKVLASPLKNAVLQQCFTKICLPSPQALLEGAGDYQSLGMNDWDRELIAHAVPKSEYYVASPDGKRMISLELGQVALSFLAASNDSDRALVDQLIVRYGAKWPGPWLRMRGLPDWADEFDALTNTKENKEELTYA